MDEEGGSGLVREGTTAGMLGSCGMARARVIETLSSWMGGVESERWSGTLHIGYEDGSSRM